MHGHREGVEGDFEDENRRMARCKAEEPDEEARQWTVGLEEGSGIKKKSSRGTARGAVVREGAGPQAG